MSSAEQVDSSDQNPDSDTERSSESNGTVGGAGGLRLPKVAEKDQGSLVIIAIRDLAAFAVLLSIFGGADTWARSSGLSLAAFVVVIVGLLGGAAAAAVAHEWGHFVGARLGGGHSPTKPVKAFPQVFDFDYAGNSAKSFLWMSVGGNLGNWGMALMFAMLLPLGTVGPDALVSGAIGFSVFSAMVEFPVIRNARAGMSGLEALGQIPKDFSTRYVPHAVGAAILMFIIL